MQYNSQFAIAPQARTLAGGEDTVYFDYLDDEAYYRAGNRDSCMLNLADTSDQAYLDYLAMLEAGNIGAFYQINAALLHNNLNDAATIISNVQYQNQIEAYKRFVLNYYLLYIADTLEPEEGVVEELTAIAYTHPFYGGQAVYWARAILHIDVVDILPPFRRGKPKNATTTIIENALTYYPNPANNILNIASKNKFTIDSRIIIKNQLGQIVIAHELPFNKIETALNIESLKAGCYFICYFTNSKQVSAK
ncbi:MAG: T9SS type A sorting domain-containing protein [Bacteroidetes bacterium]|nr:T9SS type A sorting domain-containing protein [Bacteroidota bacterium]